MRVGSAYACRGFCLGRKRRLIIGDPNPCRFIEAPSWPGLGWLCSGRIGRNGLALAGFAAESDWSRRLWGGLAPVLGRGVGFCLLWLWFSPSSGTSSVSLFRGAWLCWWCDSGGLAQLRRGFGGLAGGGQCGVWRWLGWADAGSGGVLGVVS